MLARLGLNIQNVRRSRDITQERLAEMVDLHPRIVQKIEAGELNPKSTTLIRIQVALGCGCVAIPLVELTQTRLTIIL